MTIQAGPMRDTVPEEQSDTLAVARKIRVSYWAAILLIGALAVACFAIFDREIRNQSADKELIFLAGEQILLSQRIAALSRTAHDEDQLSLRASALNELRERVAVFEANHARLDAAVRSAAGLDEAARTELASILAGEPAKLDLNVETMIRDARLLADPSASPAPAPVPAPASEAVLAGYERISGVLQANAERLNAEGGAVFQKLSAAMLLVLAASVMFIFRPMIRAVAQRTRDLMTARNEMEFLAAHDRLTGLRNRVFLTDHFEHMIENARRRNERVAVLHLDLDNFKSVNDTYGHAAGDHVLKEVAARIKTVVRAADIAARVGGDEFVILLNGPGDGDDIARVAGRVIESVNRPIEFETMVFRSGASIGVSIFPDDADTPEDLLIDSDLALYQAKDAGRGCMRFFSSELRNEHEFRREMEVDLRESLRRGEIFVHYQPQVSLATARVTGIEALARWNRKGNEYVPPDVFLPVAEKAGFLEAIGRQVMSIAIAQAAEWHNAGVSFGRIAINAARAELVKEDFVSFILGQADMHGLPTNKLSVEVVEGVILDDPSLDISAKLRQLRAAGVYVELDDFGTGYASLTHINSNEIDRLKIDERFIQGIDSDKSKRRIVRALIDLARGLDIAVVAEGAETVGELETLREIGCPNVQGFGIAFPMAAELLTEWLQMHAPGTPIPFFDDDRESA